MEISIPKRWNFAIVVTKEDLESIGEIFSEHYKVRAYTAECIDGTKIECSSLDELLEYENTSARRIDLVTIEICNVHEQYIGYVTLQNSEFGYGSSCEFEITDSEDARVASTSKKLEELVTDLKQWYSWLQKYDLISWVCFLIIFVVVISTWYETIFINQGKLTTHFDFSIISAFYLMLPFFALIFWLLLYLNKKWKWLFPRVFFALGRQEKEWAKRTIVRNWIIRTFIASVLIPIILLIIPF